ncbi:hypothetical protein EMIHUDRAFT_43489, partial [Emiliania huxleyi CCMP1516]|uniref:Kinesin-like protein n=2 Tax=Emiliania huxleyi TaxID=2903 RepID=A0A0D3KDD0_EMIH1
YHFDSVYTSYSTQCEVFETVRPLVHEVMQGFEATVFAYGQTGTGKTHTMEGEIVCEEKKGIIPRAVEAIFESLGEKGKYVSSAVSASYLEIYNEELSDLLTEARGRARSREIARDRARSRETGVYAHNLSEHEVCSAADVLGLIARAQERRRVGETRMNKHSSRSHCVFTLTVTTRETTSEGMTMESTGKLHLVDLAGSECAKTAAGSAAGGGSGAHAAHDARERERKNINQSLLTLGRDVFLFPSQARIPYRDSKLTRLLQESLGGRCKTVVIATLSPSQLAVEESASTL